MIFNERNVTIEGPEDLGTDSIWLQVRVLLASMLLEKTFDRCDRQHLPLISELVKNLLDHRISHFVTVEVLDSLRELLEVKAALMRGHLCVRLEILEDTRVSLAELFS